MFIICLQEVGSKTKGEIRKNLNYTLKHVFLFTRHLDVFSNHPPQKKAKIKIYLTGTLTAQL